MAKHAESRTLSLAKRHTKFRRVTFAIAVMVAVAMLVVHAIWLAQSAEGLDPLQFALSIAVLVLLTADAAGCLALVVVDYATYDKRMRAVSQITLVCLVATVVVQFMAQGFRLVQLVYVYLFFCITAFMALTDEKLARNERFQAPWDMDADSNRRDCIPLNFFNVFWVFVIASMVGLGVEVLYRAISTGVLENRAGLLWGPFSPIYGAGAVLMTIALNRYWNKSALLTFTISALIGASFEWFASFFWETAFGIKAWDYTGNLGSLGGRTDVFHALAWGLLGLLWIRALLPSVLRAVDAIPLNLRAGITTVFALFMLADATMTLVALDSWFERSTGAEVQGVLQSYCAFHYDDSFMAKRFETMNMDVSRSARSGQAPSAMQLLEMEGT